MLGTTSYEAPQSPIPQKITQIIDNPISINQQGLEGSFDANTALIKQYFPDNYEVMIRIAYCESGMKQFDSKGNVIRSHTKDVGILQIHEPLWKEKSEELGYDIYTLAGNVKMARYIYGIQKESAWVCNRIINK